MITTTWEIILHIIILLSIIALIFVIIYQKYFSNCNLCNTGCNRCNRCNRCPCQCLPKVKPKCGCGYGYGYRYRCGKLKCSMCNERNNSFAENFGVDSDTTDTTDTTDDTQKPLSSEDKLYNDITDKINDLYSTNYDAIKTFLDNQIDIDNMIERVTQINKKLETNIHKKTKITANGDIEFY